MIVAHKKAEGICSPMQRLRKKRIKTAFSVSFIVIVFSSVVISQAVESNSDMFDPFMGERLHILYLRG